MQAGGKKLGLASTPRRTSAMPGRSPSSGSGQVIGALGHGTANKIGIQFQDVLAPAKLGSISCTGYALKFTRLPILTASPMHGGWSPRHAGCSCACLYAWDHVA